MAETETPWVEWNRDHPELVCTETRCPHNRQPIERRQGKAWQFMHTLSHGKGTFSAETLAHLSDRPLAEAEAVIKLGVEIELIRKAQETKNGVVYARHFKELKAPKSAPKKLRDAQAFGRAASTLWGDRA